MIYSRISLRYLCGIIVYCAERSCGALGVVQILQAIAHSKWEMKMVDQM